MLSSFGKNLENSQSLVRGKFIPDVTVVDWGSQTVLVYNKQYIIGPYNINAVIWYDLYINFIHRKNWWFPMKNWWLSLASACQMSWPILIEQIILNPLDIAANEFQSISTPILHHIFILLFSARENDLLWLQNGIFLSPRIMRKSLNLVDIPGAWC